MSWRMHIAVVDTDKAQKMRVLPAEHYEKLRRDWMQVQKVTCETCMEAFKFGDLEITMLNDVEEKLKEMGYSYEKRNLESYFHYISDGNFNVDSDIDGDFTQFNQFVEEDMGVIEDYTLGRFDISKDIGNPFFTHADTQEMFEHYNPRVIHKKDFESIIELWRKLIVEQYKEILADPSKALRWQGNLEAKLECWESPYIEPYNLDENQKCIVRDYSLEYRIFDLIRLYKSIDWMRDTVIFFGW